MSSKSTGRCWISHAYTEDPAIADYVNLHVYKILYLLHAYLSLIIALIGVSITLCHYYSGVKIYCNYRIVHKLAFFF